MSQLHFDISSDIRYQTPAKKEEPLTHAEQLLKVRGKLRSMVLAFCGYQYATGREFYMSELCMYVWKFDPTIAPNSPYRIFYELNKEGAFGYEAERNGKYKITRFPEETFQTLKHYDHEQPETV